MDQFGTEWIRGLVDVDTEASRFQRDDYDYGLTDLEGIKDTLALAQKDRTGLVERMAEMVFKNPSAETKRLQFDEIAPDAGLDQKRHSVRCGHTRLPTRPPRYRCSNVGVRRRGGRDHKWNRRVSEKRRGLRPRRPVRTV